MTASRLQLSACLLAVVAVSACTSASPAAPVTVTTTAYATQTITVPATAGTTTTTVTETATVTAAARGSSTAFDHFEVEAGVTKILTDAPPAGYGKTNVDTVSCPADQPVKTGSTFTCTVDIKGSSQSVLVTVKDDTGRYEVGVPN